MTRGVSHAMVAAALVALAIAAGALGSALGYIDTIRSFKARPPALVYVNVTGLVARAGRLTVELNVSAMSSVQVTGGYLRLFPYNVSTLIGPDKGEVNVTMPLLPQLLSASYIYVMGYVNVSFEGSKGYVTFTRLVPLNVVISLALANVSWTYSPSMIVLLLNYSFPYNATLNVSGELVSTSAQQPNGVIDLGPQCWGTASATPGTGELVVNLTHCGLALDLKGKYMASWYFAGTANVTFETPVGAQTRTYRLYLYHGGSSS